MCEIHELKCTVKQWNKLDLGSIPSRGWIIIFPSCPTSYEAHIICAPTQRSPNGCSFARPFRTEVLNMCSFTSTLAIYLDCKVHANCVLKHVVYHRWNCLRLCVWRNEGVSYVKSMYQLKLTARATAHGSSRVTSLFSRRHAHCSWVYRLKAGALGVAATLN